MTTKHTDLKRGPCVACGKNVTCDVDHIRTRGAGGKDDENNVWALCRPCHTAKGTEGIHTFVKRRPHLLRILNSKGWTFLFQFGKYILVNDKYASFEREYYKRKLK